METTTEFTEKAKNWQETAEDLKGRASRWQHAISDKAHQTGRVVQDYVHENTWVSVAIAAALGCVVGMLLFRGRD